MSFKDLTRRGLRRLRTGVALWIHGADEAVAERTLPSFANRPEHLKIDLPRRILNPECMTFGKRVWLGPGCFLAAVKEYPSPSLRHPESDFHRQSFSPAIRIGDRVTSTGNLVIGAARRVDIGDDVMFAFNVTILDNSHGFKHPNTPYKYQPLERIAPVEIGRGCWIGQNTVIMAGVEIGEMAIIGANSVVTRSIPARSIAIGAPARVIKQWDERSCQWRPYKPVPRAAARLG
jgi:acetyltransferase-like isoleucine patch superfamily enzyme